MELVLEASVSTDHPIIQTVELFNFQTSAYETVAIQLAQYSLDRTTLVIPTGNATRFVNSGTSQISARVRFESLNPIKPFSVDIDFAEWRVQSGTPDSVNSIVPLFDATTQLEPATTILTNEALITRVGDRVRDRHAREAQFQAYDHYLEFYWEERTVSIEIIDSVAQGGNSITINTSTLTPLSTREFRAFFRGQTTAAEYFHNVGMISTGTNAYTTTITFNPKEGRPIQIGDRMEFEFSPFLLAPMNGRLNYYGTAFLYVVGEGLVPWRAEGTFNDSFPLPETSWLGGQTTIHYQYSNEPDNLFKQMAGNLAPASAQPFVLGRRLHHTDFGNGAHSEQPNPSYFEQAGKLGPLYIARSCVECHVNNGRSVPPDVGETLLRSVVKVGSNAAGVPHPILGSVIQPRSTSGPSESATTIDAYATTTGTYGDGETYELRKPIYAFSSTVPEFFSVRVAPPLIGMGLLEAVSESEIIALADPDDLDGDGISGRVQIVFDPETGEPRLGRFTEKAGQARLSHQIAAAFNTDMGVTTNIFPVLDGGASSGAAELSDQDLSDLTRYVATLGVGARRDLDNAEANLGENLFLAIGCADCHTPTLSTSPYHPAAELRNQTIHPYSDMLLHDMGSGLADSMGELRASGAEWRTKPLWNIGRTPEVNGKQAYLHDGRARTLAEAILWHGGEAESSKEAFRTMPALNRQALVTFLESL